MSGCSGCVVLLQLWVFLCYIDIPCNGTQAALQVGEPVTILLAQTSTASTQVNIPSSFTVAFTSAFCRPSGLAAPDSKTTEEVVESAGAANKASDADAAGEKSKPSPKGILLELFSGGTSDDVKEAVSSLRCEMPQTLWNTRLCFLRSPSRYS
jgi:hypothetical protein